MNNVCSLSRSCAKGVFTCLTLCYWHPGFPLKQYVYLFEAQRQKEKSLHLPVHFLNLQTTNMTQIYHVSGMTPIIWAISAASLDLHEQETGIKSRRWESNRQLHCGTQLSSIHVNQQPACLVNFKWSNCMFTWRHQLHTFPVYSFLSFSLPITV